MAGSSKQFFKYTVVENVIGNIAQKTDIIIKLYLITKKFEVFLIIWKGYFLSYFKIMVGLTTLYGNIEMPKKFMITAITNNNSNITQNNLPYLLQISQWSVLNYFKTSKLINVIRNKYPICRTVLLTSSLAIFFLEHCHKPLVKICWLILCESLQTGITPLHK